MQNLVRSKTVGVTGNGGRGTAGAGPGRDLLYGSRGVAAPYRRTGDLGPHEPRPRTPRVQIVESVESTPDLDAREERRCSERRALAGYPILSVVDSEKRVLWGFGATYQVFGAAITKKPYFLPKTNMYGLSYTKAAIRN